MSDKNIELRNAPVFYKKLKNLSTSEGECLVLECRVKANPAPQVMWKREGFLIEDSSDFRILFKGDIATLVIGETFPEDSGRFSCEAMNDLGNTTTSCKVVVKGTNKSITTLASKSPASAIGGIDKTVPDSGSKSPAHLRHHHTHVTHCFIIPNRASSNKTMEKPPLARPPVAPRPSAFAFTSFASLRHQSNVTNLSCNESHEKTRDNCHVMTSLSHVTEGSSEVAPSTMVERQAGKRMGEYIVCSPTASGILPLQQQEYKVSSFEQRLINEIEYRLERVPPVCEDPEDEIFEEVLPPKQVNPIFVALLKNFKAIEGSTATLSCRISAKPRAKVFWFKDGKQISRRSLHYKQESDGKGGHLLYVTNLSTEDNGNYTAVACNPKGRVSCTGRLAVFTRKSSAIPKDFAATLKITANLSLPNKGQLTSDEESAVERYYRPTFLQKPPAETNAQEGSLVRFDAKMSGLPSPDIAWMINGKPVVQDSLHKIVVRENNVHSLLLERVSPMDEGQYTIKATNRAGTTLTHVQLRVIAREYASAPAFIQRLVSKCVAEGDSVRLEARMVGTPRPRVCWKRGIDQVTPSNRIHLFEGDAGYVCLQITQAQLSDAEWYTCSATNSAGISTCNCKLDVYSPASNAPPRRVRIRTPNRYAKLSRAAGVDFRETFSPEAPKCLPESEDL